MDGHFSVSFFRENLSRQEDLRDTAAFIQYIYKKKVKELNVTINKMQLPADHHSTHTLAMTLNSHFQCYQSSLSAPYLIKQLLSAGIQGLISTSRLDNGEVNSGNSSVHQTKVNI